MTAFLVSDRKDPNLNTDIVLLNMSVSKIKTFDEKSGGCKKKFKHLYLEKFPRKDWPQTVLGSYLHLVLEIFHKKLLISSCSNLKELLSECEDEALKKWENRLSIEQKEEAYQILQAYLLKLEDKEFGNYRNEIIDLEKEFFISINDKILLNGVIDRFEKKNGIYHVGDYKSSKNDKYLKNDFFQLSVYAYAVYLMFPDIEYVVGEYIMLRHNFKKITKKFSREEILAVEPKLLQYAKEIEEERLFRANPGPLCSYCEMSDESLGDKICEDRWIKPDKNQYKKQAVTFKIGESDW